VATLKVEIVTPEARCGREATALVARSTEGWFTVLPEHMDMVGDVVPSVVRVGTTEGEIAIAVHGGFFQVGPAREKTRRSHGPRGHRREGGRDRRGPRQAAKEAAQARSRDSRNDQETAASTMARAALERAELRLNAAKS